MTLVWISITFNTKDGVRLVQKRFKAKELNRTYRMSPDTNKKLHTKVVPKSRVMVTRSVFTNVITGDSPAVFSWNIWCLPSDQQQAKELLVDELMVKIHQISKRVNEVTEKIDDQFGIYGPWPTPDVIEEGRHDERLVDIIEHIEGQQNEF